MPDSQAVAPTAAKTYLVIDTSWSTKEWATGILRRKHKADVIREHVARHLAFLETIDPDGVMIIRYGETI